MGLMKRKIGPYGPSPFLSALDPYTTPPVAVLEPLCFMQIDPYWANYRTSSHGTVKGPLPEFGYKRLKHAS